jgi:hypothetical protein
MKPRYASISSFLLRTGNATQIAAPPNTEWSLLFAHRVPLPGLSFASPAVLTAMVVGHGGRLDDKFELLSFAPNESNTLVPSLELDSSASVVCSVEGGNSVIRLLFASKSPASLIVTSRDPTARWTADPLFLAEMRRISRSERPVQLMLLFFSIYMPNSFFVDPSVSKFHPFLVDVISLALKRIEKPQLLTEFIEMISFADLQFTLGEAVTDGFVVLFVTFVNDYPEFVDYIIAVSLQRRSFITFQFLLTFAKSKAVFHSALLRPLPRFPVRDIEPLYLLFGFVAERKMKFHYQLLNLFAKISPREELEIVFDEQNIFGLQSLSPPKPSLFPVFTMGMEIGQPACDLAMSPIVKMGADRGGPGWSFLRAVNVDMRPREPPVSLARSGGVAVIDIAGNGIVPGQATRGDLRLTYAIGAALAIVLLVCLVFFVSPDGWRTWI